MTPPDTLLLIALIAFASAATVFCSRVIYWALHRRAYECCLLFFGLGAFSLAYFLHLIARVLLT